MVSTNQNGSLSELQSERRRRVRLIIILLCVFALLSVISVYCHAMMYVPMTPERYRYYCGEQSECYPESLYFFGFLFASPFAFLFGVLLLFTSVSFFARRP
jgi:hypothetical protein